MSMNDSPFERLLDEAEKSTTSAPSRRAASAKLVLVRVEFSKNRLTIVVPFSTESLRRQPSVASLKRRRRVEQRADLVGRQPFEVEEVAMRPLRRHGLVVERGRGHAQLSGTAGRSFRPSFVAVSNPGRLQILAEPRGFAGVAAVAAVVALAASP